MSFEIAYLEGWDRHFKDFENSFKIRILKKIEQLRDKPEGRHLHGKPFFIEEVAGCRIAYKSDDSIEKRTIHFVGDHKQYERWYKNQ